MFLVALSLLWVVSHIPERFRIHQITRLTNRGDISVVGISAHGDRVAYSAEKGGSGSLYVHQFGSTGLDSVRVAHYVEQNIGTTFSPDDRFIYFVLHSGGEGNLYRVPVGSGDVQKILEDIDSPITFAPDGQHFAFERFDGSTGSMFILVADSEGKSSSIRARITYHPLVLSRTLDWTPDGDSILFGLYDESAPGLQKIKFAQLSLRTGKIEYGKPPSFSWMGSLVAFSRNGVLVPASSETSGPAHLYQVEWQTGASKVLTNETANYLSLSSTLQRDKLAAIELNRHSSVWILKNALSTPLTSSQGVYLGIAWTEDGSLLIGGQMDGDRGLVNIDPKSKQTTQITTGATADMFPQVTNTGFVVFSSDRDNGYHIWRATLDGKNPRRLTTDTATELDPAVSPDGKTVFYSSDRDGVMKIWKVSIEGGIPENVVPAPSRHPDVSPDGKWLLCEKSIAPSGQWQVAMVSSADGSTKNIFPKLPTDPPDTHDQAKRVRWSRDGLHFLYTSNVDGTSRLLRQRVDGSFPLELTLLKEGTFFDFAESVDGTSIAYIQGNSGGDIDLVTGVH